ncbi:PQQ-binding-like beta-propeller repeat protein [Candidatus Aenigmatarchaeota archaeon]
MVRYSLRNDYDSDNVKIGVSVDENLDLKIEFLTEMIRETNAVLIFNLTVGGSIVSRPVIKDSMVYFGACDKNVYAVDLETGEEVWRFPTNGPIIEAVAIDNGRIYAESYDGNLYSLDMEGNLVWKFCAGDKIASAPQVYKGNIYFGCKDGNVYAIDRNGKLLWKFHTNGPIGSPVAIYKDRIYAGSLDYNLYSLDMKGNLIWKFAAQDHAGGPCVHEDVIYFGSFDQCIYALDIRGKMLWKFEMNDIVPVSTNIVAENGIIYFGSRDNNFYAVENGRTIWKFKTNNMILSKPVIEDGKVYFCSTDGNLYVLDIKTGEEMWRFTANGPAILPEKSGDIVCFGCYDCNLYAINTKGELLWKFHTSMNSPSDIDFTPETEHTIFVPIPEYEAERKELVGIEEKRLMVYGDFKGNYIEDEMKDYIGLPVRDGGPKMLYKNKKRVYQK